VGTEVTVGIDIGTSSVKAIAADGDGKVVARSRVPHQVVVPAPERFEHDAAAAWRDGPRRALAELGGDLDVRGVSVAAMVPSLTAVDGTGVDGRRHDTADALVIGMVVAGEVGEPGFVCDHRRRAIGDDEFGDRAAQQFNRDRLSGVERAQCRQLSCHQLRKALPARGRVADAAQAAVGEAQE